MIKHFTKLGIAVALVVGSLSGANAATFSGCSGTGYDISGKVHDGTASKTSISSDCTISDDFDQDFLNTTPTTVNTPPGFFNRTDWVFEGKIGSDTNFNGDTGGQSGTFDLTNAGLDLSSEDVMLIFKSGNGTTLVGYILTALEGGWDSPFTDPPFDFNGNSPKNVSHISVYTSAAVVPLPAGILFLLTGLGGLVLLRRRGAQAA